MRHNNSPAQYRKQSGFTIVELMIATAVFAVILVVITVGVVTFTKNYYKGVNSSITQNTARGIINAVSQAVEFGQSNLATSSAPAMGGGTEYTYCFGNEQFDYLLDQESTAASPNILVESPSNTTGGCNTLTSFPAGNTSQQLIGNNLRLLEFSITPVSGLPADTLPTYTITVQVAYGGDDLLCNSNYNGDCTSSSNSTQLEASGAVDTCKPTSGSQFCDVSTLTTTAQMRSAPQS